MSVRSLGWQLTGLCLTLESGLCPCPHSSKATGTAQSDLTTGNVKFWYMLHDEIYLADAGRLKAMSPQPLNA